MIPAMGAQCVSEMSDRTSRTAEATAPAPFAGLRPYGHGRSRGAGPRARRSPVRAQQLRESRLSGRPQRCRTRGNEVLPNRTLVGPADSRGARLRPGAGRAGDSGGAADDIGGATLHDMLDFEWRCSRSVPEPPGTRSGRRAGVARAHARPTNSRCRCATPVPVPPIAGPRAMGRQSAARAHALGFLPEHMQQRYGEVSAALLERSAPPSTMPLQSPRSACTAIAISATSCGSSAARCWSIWTIA